MEAFSEKNLTIQKNSETVFTPELKGYKSITSRKQLVDDLKTFKVLRSIIIDIFMELALFLMTVFFR